MKIEIPTISDVILQNWIQNVSDILNSISAATDHEIVLRYEDDDPGSDYVNITNSEIITEPYSYVNKLSKRRIEFKINVAITGICTAHSLDPNMITIINGLIDAREGIPAGLFAFSNETEMTGDVYEFRQDGSDVKIYLDGTLYQPASVEVKTLFLAPYYQPGGVLLLGTGKINGCEVYEKVDEDQYD